MDKFTLDEQTTGSLDLFPETNSVTYGPDYSAKKAERFAMVLGEKSPGTDVLRQSIETGSQDNWKEIAKMQEDVKNSFRRNELIQDIARQTTGKPTPDTVSVVSSLADDELYSADIDTIVEQKYADLFINTASSYDENVIFPEAEAENSDDALETLDRTAFAQERLLLAEDKLQEMNKKYEDSGYLEKGVAFLKGMIPGYDWYKTRNRIEGAETVSLLQGNNLGEQVQSLYRLPPKEFKETLSKAVDELAEDNIRLAQEFSQAVVSYSSSDQAMSNFFNALDIVDIATMGAGAALTGSAKLAKAGKSVLRGSLRSPSELAKVAGDLGFNRSAAVSDVVEKTVGGDFMGVRVTLPQDIETRLPSIYAPQKAFTGASSLESASQNRLRETILRNADLAKEFLNTGQLVDRLEPGQIKLAADEAFDRVKDTFTNVNHHILDMKVIPAADDPLLNTGQISVRFGKKDGTLFQSEASAKMFAGKYIGLKTKDFTVQADSLGGYYIDVRKSVADVGNWRSLEIETDLKSPASVSNQFIGYLRSSDYLLPQQNVMARGRVVHGQEYLSDYMKQLTEPFRGKSTGWINDLEKVLKSNRVNRKYYQTVEEFEGNFLNTVGKAPDEDQAAAYFSYVQLNDLDYIIRDADLVKQKRRLGGERVEFKAREEGMEPKTASFDGKVVDRLPYDSKSNYNVVVINDGILTKPTNSRFFGESKRLEYDALLEAGYKAVLNPEESTYYLVKDFKRSDIPLGILNRVEGGHNEYRYSHFIKQGEVKVGGDRVARYKGDKSLFVTTTERQAKEIASLFERARVLVKNGDPSAQKFVTDNLPISYGDFIKKVKTGDINLDTSIMATTRGQRTADIHQYANDYEYFDDAVRSEHNVFSSVGGRYTTERAEETLDVLRSEDGVVFRTDLEPLLNPIETLRSSTANMLDVRLVNDYRNKSVTDWVQEFGPLLDANMNQVAANPLEYLQKAVYKSGADPNQVKIAEQVRASIVSLNDYRSPIEAQFQVYKEKLLSSVYDNLGEKARQIVDERTPMPTDVPTFMRRAAFSMKLGFFNPKQLFLQASSVVSAISVSPRQGLFSARALPLTRIAMTTDNEATLRGMFNKYGKVSGWEKEDWMDMVRSYKQSGFATVGQDVAYLDDFRPATFGKNSMAGKAWSYNTAFYNEGEKISRTVAYGIAWREFKETNPGKALDRFAESKILQRAKDLTMNMTRDSNAAWQRGGLSVATQFMGYQARFMEQLWDGGMVGAGRKLNPKEKFRLVAGMSAVYGVPMVGSAYVGVWPVRDWLKEQLHSEGREVDGTLIEPLVDGLLPSMVEAMTGVDMAWSEAYGPNGLPTLRDALNGDATLAEMFGGASGGVIATTASQAIPALKGIYDMTVSDEGSTWPVLMQDLLEPLKNISTVSSGVKLYEAVNTQRYLSNKGTYLTDVTIPEAVTSAIMGVNPDRVSDAYSKIAVMRGTKEDLQQYQNEVQSNMERGLRMMKKGDEESAEVYFSRAHSAAIRGGLTLKEINTAKSRALRETPLDDNIMQNFEKRVLRRLQEKGK